ncbi:MAG: succinate dehydrogenase, cytochrome b556 subunit [Chromatiales bacterium]|nr:succinate dehydrogenase, cytochrome b556 subunit [Chromatiales bacterium]
MRNLSKPLSPHLQIYRLPITAILSILHRMTGIVLSLGIVLLVVVLATAAWQVEAYRFLQAILSHWIGQLFLIAWTASLYLHLCNGIRHLFWDAGLGFDLKTTGQTAYLTIASTVVLTVATWLAVYFL